jgi:tetratricopeptide (TPR) repeat protein
MRPEACVELVGAAAAGSKPKELGNTCFMYIGIEQWRDAEQACLRGLSVADEPSTRGAILYNLGLIAEAEGAREQAGLYYRESLAVRPRNRAVERRLAKLRLP